MSEFFNVIIDITLDVFRNVAYFLKNNLMNIASVLNFILPFGMYFIGLYTGSFDWVYLVVPIAFAVIGYYIKSAANKLGKGITIPIPSKRFTNVDEDGEVTVETGRIQELILYTADLEDWMERKGLY